MVRALPWRPRRSTDNLGVNLPEAHAVLIREPVPSFAVEERADQRLTTLQPLGQLLLSYPVFQDLTNHRLRVHGAEYHIRVEHGQLFPNTIVINLSDTIPDMKDLADRLIKARTDRGMTQEELAKAAGVSQSTIGNLESRLRFSARKLAVIANVLGVDALWLETGEGSPGSTDDLQLLVANLSGSQRKAIRAVIDSYADARNATEQELLSFWRRLDGRGQKEAMSALRTLVDAVEAERAASGSSSDRHNNIRAVPQRTQRK